ncbi:helix-turn-helix transcriptional regulator [Sodalis sp. C49]|uniref:helix-turn-helix transcriptional regulator n=1 Tax=unclassified Sodalis (in: enterobacteria) TaxID=2636512 RepID=UPI003965D2B8
MRVFRVEQALKKLGRDIQDARKRRRISTSLMAERIGITRATLSRLEAGDAKVSMGSYAIALYVLGKLDQLENIIDRTQDPLGLDLMDDELPVRIRTRRTE